MKSEKKSRTNLLLALLLGLLVIGYKVVFVAPTEDFSQDANTMASIRVNAILNQVQSISFDTSILQDNKLRSLKSIETPLPLLPVGKSNPFSN